MQALLADACLCGSTTSFFSSVLFQSHGLKFAGNKCYQYYLIGRNFRGYKVSRVWGSFTKINPSKLQFDKSFAKICPAKFFWFCHSRKFVSAKSFFTLKFFQENLYLQKCGPMIRLFTGILNNSYPKRSSNWTEKYTEKAQQTAVSEDVQEEVRK